MGRITGESIDSGGGVPYLYDPEIFRDRIGTIFKFQIGDDGGGEIAYLAPSPDVDPGGDTLAPPPLDRYSLGEYGAATLLRAA